MILASNRKSNCKSESIDRKVAWHSQLIAASLIGAVFSAQLLSPPAARGQEANSSNASTGKGIEPNYLAVAAANGAARWPSRRLPIKVWIKDDSSVPGFRPEFKAVVESALKDWTAATNDRIRFVPGTATDANMTFSWTTDAKEMMSPTEGGHAVVIPDGDGIFKATITLLTKQLDGKPISDAYAKHIDLHEIGHALGILGHSESADDIMYGVIKPGDTRTTLSQSDINTLNTLYSPAGDSFAKKPIDLEKMTAVGDQSSPIMRSVRLNAEAAVLLQQSKYADAMHKLEEAHSLDPTNNLISGNLGSVYANVAAFAVMMKKTADADAYFQKAIALLEKSGNNSVLKTVLTNYATVLRSSGKMAEAEKLDVKARKLP